MSLEKNQEKTGFEQEESTNPTPRTGRDDGMSGGQATTGHLDEESGPISKGGTRDVPSETQGKTFKGEDSTNKKGSPASTPTRIDKISEV